MKRTILAAFTLLIIFVVSVYFFIPSQILVKSIVPVRCNGFGADRVLGDTGHWKRWWPVNGELADHEGTQADHEGANTWYFRGCRYRMNRRLLRSVEIAVAGKGEEGGKEVLGLLSVFPMVRDDSCYLLSEFSLEGGLNPIQRIKQYQWAKELHSDMEVILGGLRSYLEEEDHVYGISISEESAKDNLLIESTRMAGSYPSTGDIYLLVKKLQGYILLHHGLVTGYPMINIMEKGGQFELRVAIPTNQPVPEKDSITNRTLPGNKFLEAEVKGGPATVNEAMAQMNNYISDYHRTVMAIPFFSLETDRSAEPDSAKWMTRIYFPIFPLGR
jgi:effector-binding domain-containing protein